MLNLKEIALRIRNPHLCEMDDIPTLKALCDTHPYSQIFPLLYLQTLAKNNDIRLDAELQSYAYRIADRTVLFDLLNTFTETNADAQKTGETPPTTQEQDGAKKSLPSLPDDVLKSLGIGTQHYSIEEEIQETPTKDRMSSPQQIEKLSFFEWIDKNSPGETEETRPTPQQHSTSALIDRFINNENVLTQRREKQLPLSSASTHVLPQAEQSIDETELPASETLARIFVAQGNFPRAIATYRQLCLLIPQKKSFFADQIEMLTQKMHLK